MKYVTLSKFVYIQSCSFKIMINQIGITSLYLFKFISVIQILYQLSST